MYMVDLLNQAEAASRICWGCEMGEISEMIVEGILCETCAVLIDGEAPGHPRRCDDCPPEELTPEAQSVMDLMAKLRESLESDE